MSLRGVRQLKELLIRYSDYDGSSKGVREWMRLNLITFAKENPDTIVKTVKKRCAHPFLRGIYLNENTKTIGVKNLEPEQIHSFAMDLRNQIGGKVTTARYKKPVITRSGSIQGEWNERLDLIDLKFTIEHQY